MKDSKGHYSGRYTIEESAYTGIDFSKRCAIFPGQGSAFPGMFAIEYMQIPSVRTLFDTADRLCEELGIPKASTYILHPDEIEEPMVRILSNLALLTVEVALFEHLRAQRVRFGMLTGHSFGEYAVLVAAGVSSFEQMFEIVYTRDRLCPERQVAGTMIAIRAGATRVEEMLAGETFYISNRNSFDQTVISVAPEHIARVEGILAAQPEGYKILTAVPQPYHSPLLEPARTAFSTYIASREWNFQKPETPFFSSVAKKCIDAETFSEQDIREILSAQLIEPVDFIAQVQGVYTLGYAHFVELGPKKVFLPFVENILKGSEYATTFSGDLLGGGKEKKIVKSDSKIFHALVAVISRITGYTIEQISFEDRFQDNLGIDSIKKADILLTVIDESQLGIDDDFNTGEIASIRDAVEYFEKPKIERKKRNVTDAVFKRYTFMPVEKPLAAQCLDTRTGLEYNTLSLREFLLQGASYLARCGGTAHTVIRLDSDPTVEEVRTILQIVRDSLVGAGDTPIGGTILLVSTGSTCRFARSLATLAKSVKKEHPQLFVKCVHMEDVEEEAQSQYIRAELCDYEDTDVWYTGALRGVYEPKEVVDTEDELQMDNQTVVVAVGGASGITRSLVEGIVKDYQPIVYLLGRSSVDSEKVVAALATLGAYGSDVHYEQVDARDVEAVEHVFAKIYAEQGRIDFILNGAGVVDVGFLAKKTNEDIVAEFDAKVLSALAVTAVAQQYAPKRILNFSSIISRYGSAGQVVYTTANQVVCDVCEEYKNASVVHWPAWDGIGMTSDPVTLQKLREYGTPLLDASAADKLFRRELLGKREPSVYYMTEDDDSALSFGLQNLAALTPLVGELRDPYQMSFPAPTFKKTFSLERDAYLKDHLVQGEPFVPLATMLAMATALGRAFLRVGFLLRDIETNFPIVVQSEQEYALSLEKEIDVYRAALSRGGVRHFSAMLVPHIEEVRTALVQEDGEELSTEFLYRRVSKEAGLWIGKSLQTIARLYRGPEGVYSAELDLAGHTPLVGIPEYDRDIRCIDACLQTLGLAYVHQAGREGLHVVPSHVGEIRHYTLGVCSDRVYATVANILVEGYTVTGDVTVSTREGEVLLALTGIVLTEYGQ